MFKDTIEIFMPVFIIIAIFVMFMGVLIFLGNIAERSACDTQAVSFDRYEYSFSGGCMVENRGQWVPLSLVRVDMLND